MATSIETALLIAAGCCDPALLSEQVEASEYLIAADGGLNTLLDLGIEPHVLVGDLDSAVGHESLENTVIVRSTSQGETDLVKALLWAIDAGITSLDVIGVESGENDHILGTYAALAEVCDQSDSDVRIRLQLSDSIVHLLRSETSWSARLPLDGRISIFSLGAAARVSISGVRWPLMQEPLSFSTRGLHNESCGGVVEVEVHAGRAVLFVHR